MTSKIFYDKEAKWFYLFTCSPTVLAILLTAIQQEWVICALMIVILISFLYFGWPITAIVEDNKVTFKNPLRSVTVSQDSLSKVKAVGAQDFRAHLSIGVKHTLPIGYRLRKFDHSSSLALTVMGIIEASQDAKIDSKAVLLLQKVAKIK